MESGAALRAKAISAFRSGIRYWLSGAMLGYGVLDCACICEPAPSATTSTELANPIVLNVLRSIHFPLWRGVRTIRLIMMRRFRLACCIDHTDQYVCRGDKCQRWGGAASVHCWRKTSNCRNGDPTFGDKMPQIDGSRAIWFLVVLFFAVNPGRLHGPSKRAAIRGLPLAPGLAPGAATRAGRSPFFGMTASSVDPANSFLKRRNPHTPRSRT